MSTPGWYALDEREQQIAVLRERTRKEALPAPPTNLQQAENYSHIVSSRDVRVLAERSYNDPVISLYLHLTPQKLVPEKKGVTRFFQSLKQFAIEKRQEFIRGLPRDQKQTLDEDLEEIEAFLADHLSPGVRSVIIFKAGTALNRVIALPVRSTDNLVIDPDPYVLPLEAILEENARVLAVEVTKNITELFVYQMGYLQKVDRVKSFVPKDSVDATIPGRIQRHRLTHLQWHLKLTATQCSRLYDEWLCSGLVVIGEERVSHLLEGFLHDRLKEKIIDRIYGSPAADPRDRRDLIERALRAHKSQQEAEAVQELRDYNPDVVASGLPQVMEICNLFLARKLFINDDLEQNGFVCREHHYLSLNAGECPFCRAQLMPVENVIDEIVEIARMHGVNVTLIEYRQDLMSQFQGIAGVTYVPVSQH